MLHSEQKCAHFCSEWSIVGYGIGAFWNLWNWSIENVYKKVATLVSPQCAYKNICILMFISVLCSAGIKCTPLKVEVFPRKEIEVSVTDNGFKPHIVRIDEGNAISWAWSECDIPHTCIEVKFSHRKGCLVSKDNIERFVWTKGTRDHFYLGSELISSERSGCNLNESFSNKIYW